VSGRTREFGIRLAIGSQPWHLLTGVLAEGLVMTAIGIVAGVGSGFVLARLAGSLIQNVTVPGVLPVLGSAIVLLAAAAVASVVPAARASRVDVMQALRSE
jgi:putative ABC transport system permease protein